MFYIDNHALALPERTSGPPQKHNEWYARAENVDQVDELLEKIVERRKEGVTGATVVVSWLRRQFQPLQCCSHLGFEYIGLVRSRLWCSLIIFLKVSVLSLFFQSYSMRIIRQNR